MYAIALCLISLADPLTPISLQKALQEPIPKESARDLADSIRAMFPKKDLLKGAHLVEKDAVAFVLEAPRNSSPRVTGVNHGRGADLTQIGDTTLWARVETIATDTKFSYNFEVNGKRVGGAGVEMPDFHAPPESKQRPDARYGVYKAMKFRSEVFDNNRTGWVYVPASYDNQRAASLMVFQDGDAYKNEHVGDVVDNLIADNAMPVTILVLLNPGTNDDGKSNRSVEYDTMSDKYVTFLEKEVLPRIKKEYNLRDDAASHAIGGASSGGICAFTAAWHRPDLFGRVCSQIGSFTNIRGGNAYPELVRGEAKKPIRVFLYDGSNDLINPFGDWWKANHAMDAALREKGYDVEFLKDNGFHSYQSCGRVLPQSLRATWAGEVK